MARAHGRIIDGAGNPVPGKLYFYEAIEHEPSDWHSLVGADSRPIHAPEFGRPLRWTQKEAAAVSDPDRRGFFDVPRGLPLGTYWIDVHPSGDNGQQRWAWPLRVTGDGIPVDVRVGGPSTGIPGGQPPGPPAAGLERHFTPGTFTPSFSYYGAVGAPFDRVKRDLDRFRAAGFGSLRAWVDWPEDRAPDCRVFAPDGTVILDAALRFGAVLDYAASIGLSVDATMRAAAYDAVKKGAEGYDITCHKNALRSLLTRWGKHPALRIVDMANEAEVRGEGGHGSPDTGHVSPARFAELMTVARNVARTCLVGASVSGGGDHPGDVTANYRALTRDTDPEILLPHFARVKGWGANEGTNARALTKAIPGIPVHHQEPARNNYNGQSWPLSEFEQSFRTSKAAGSVGCCFHTGAGFDLSTKDAWDQLDATERQVVASVKGWL